MEIGKDDAAIIFKADGKTELALPKQDPKENVAANAILASAILFLLKDEDNKLRQMVYDLIDKWQDKLNAANSEDGR